jgi:hypothetical protein
LRILPFWTFQVFTCAHHNNRSFFCSFLTRFLVWHKLLSSVIACFVFGKIWACEFCSIISCTVCCKLCSWPCPEIRSNLRPQVNSEVSIVLYRIKLDTIFTQLSDTTDFLYVFCLSQFFFTSHTFLKLRHWKLSPIDSLSWLAITLISFLFWLDLLRNRIKKSCIAQLLVCWHETKYFFGSWRSAIVWSISGRNFLPPSSLTRGTWKRIIIFPILTDFLRRFGVLNMLRDFKHWLHFWRAVPNFLKLLYFQFFVNNCPCSLYFAGQKRVVIRISSFGLQGRQ